MSKSEFEVQAELLVEKLIASLCRRYKFRAVWAAASIPTKRQIISDWRAMIEKAFEDNQPQD